LVAFKCETGAAHAPAAAGGVAGAKGGVKSEQGAGVAVSQDVMRPRVLELRVSNHRLREVEGKSMTLQEEEGTGNARMKKTREDENIARRDYVAFCDFLLIDLGFLMQFRYKAGSLGAASALFI
jgi:hypothetical protein